MLRSFSTAKRRGIAKSSTVIQRAEAGQNRQTRPTRLASTIAASIIAIALTGGVNAESLAQPRDTSLERQAAAYVQFREDVAALEKEQFTSAEITREAHRRLSAHNPEQLASGWVAFAALVAADTPEFANALQDELSKKGKRGRNGKLGGRDGFLAELSQDPSYPRSLPGADEAARRVLAMTVQDTSRVTALGDAFKTQAYAMQKTKWGNAKLRASSSDRISDAEQFASSRAPAQAPTLAAATTKGVTAPALSTADSSWSADWGSEGGNGRMSEHNAQVVMDRVLNLAARYAIGATNEKLVGVYAKNDRSERCLDMARLTLKQCIAATRTSYEESFCLGEHGLKDISTCLGWVAGVDGAS